MIQSKKDLKYYLTADSARYNNQTPNILDFMLHNEKWYIYGSSDISSDRL